MEVEIWLRVGGILLLLILSAFFSSIESAFFSLSRSTIEQLGKSSDPRALKAARLMNDPRRLLAGILIGNTVVNTAAAALSALLAANIAAAVNFSPDLAVVLQIVSISAVILIASELMPKMMALRNPEGWAVKSAGAVDIMRILILPFSAPLTWLTGRIASLIGVEQHNLMAMSEEEIRAIVQIGHEHGALELDERRMIHSIFEFGDTIAREVMVPRIDMVAVDVDTPVETLLDTVVRHGHSRIPVYEKSIDNIIGIVHSKDLLSYIKQPGDFSIRKVLRKVHFVPEEKKIDDLLREFQLERIHMAIVVDEYGGTAGIVTMEDILEEIVGEIQDEYDTEQPLLKTIDDYTVLANGRIPTYDLNERLGWELIPESEGYDTLAGFIFSQLGSVPKKGDQLSFRGYNFVVEEVFGKRIQRVRLTKERGVMEGV